MMCKYTGGYIYLVSLWGLVHKKNRPEKFSFVATNDWVVLAESL